MSDSPLSDYVTTREAAAALGVSKSRVDQFCRDNRIPSRMTPLGRLIRRADLDAFAARPRAPGAPKRQEKQGSGDDSGKSTESR